MKNFSQTTNFIWSVADLLRGDYKQSEYGKVILTMTIIRRLDCVLNDTKEKVLQRLPKVQAINVQNIDPILNNIAGYNFHNHSKYDFDSLIADPENIATNFRNYINGFSESARDILEHFKFEEQINRLDEANLLFLVVKRFQEVDLHPQTIDNTHMGYLYEELIRRFSELSNETAGEHFSPREIIRLMVNILFLKDRDILTNKGIVKTLYDVCAGTGGMLSVAEEYLNEFNPDARLEVFGQELNPESYAICKSDMLIKGQKADNIKLGNSLSNDQLSGQKFDYMLTNPPFGVEWKKVAREVKDEYENMGFGGRFGAGLPRISDGSLLFLLHLISKMKQNGAAGSRIGIVLNGSPLFTGGAGSGESNIRKWIIENDMLEAIIALPDQLFYNTGISTYLWFVTNRKEPERKGKIQLINAVSMFENMSKSLGNKRHYITPEQIEEITRIYGEYVESKYCKIFDNEYFGYTRITVERPLVENGTVVKDRKGAIKPDSSLRDNEDVPLKEDIEEYFEREVLPHVHDLPAPPPKAGEFCIYVLECSNTSFYIGQTENFDKRLVQHNNGHVSWTAKYLPVIPIHWEIYNNRNDAVKREKELKTGFGRKWLKREYEKRNLTGLARQAGAWIDHSKSKVGYEINFTRYFYEYKPLRSLDEIRADILKLEEETSGMIEKVLEN